MQTGNVVNTMTKWFNLPTIEEMEDLIRDDMEDTHRDFEV